MDLRMAVVAFLGEVSAPVEAPPGGAAVVVQPDVWRRQHLAFAWRRRPWGFRRTYARERMLFGAGSCGRRRATVRPRAATALGPGQPPDAVGASGGPGDGPRGLLP